MNIFRLFRHARTERRPDLLPPTATITILIDESWTPEQCGSLLNRAPGWRLEFFAADHPSPTDPGGYVWVVRNETDDPDGTTCLRKVSNHGWSSHYLRTELADVQAELYRNRNQQGAGVRVTPGPFRIADDAR